MCKGTSLVATCNVGDLVPSWIRKIPWRRERLPTPVFRPGEFHGVAKSQTQLSDLQFLCVKHLQQCLVLSTIEVFVKHRKGWQNSQIKSRYIRFQHIHSTKTLQHANLSRVGR